MSQNTAISSRTVTRRGTPQRDKPGNVVPSQPLLAPKTERAFSLWTLVGSLGCFKGKLTGNHGFYHQIEGFPVNFPIIQFYDWWYTYSLWKIWVRPWEGWHPIYEMENKIQVPNHQPDKHVCFLFAFPAQRCCFHAFLGSVSAENCQPATVVPWGSVLYNVLEEQNL